MSPSLVPHRTRTYYSSDGLVSVHALLKIIKELRDRHALGSLELKSAVDSYGFAHLYPNVTAKLIKAVSMLPPNENNEVAGITFEKNVITLSIYNYKLMTLSELGRIARICNFAGFVDKTHDDYAFNFSVQVRPTEELVVYAVEFNPLLNIFRQYFPELQLQTFKVAESSAQNENHK